MREWSRAERAVAGRIGFVPTMGFLHRRAPPTRGPGQTARRARRDGIFVNPLQSSAHRGSGAVPARPRARPHARRRARRRLLRDRPARRRPSRASPLAPGQPAPCGSRRGPPPVSGTNETIDAALGVRACVAREVARVLRQILVGRTEGVHEDAHRDALGARLARPESEVPFVQESIVGTNPMRRPRRARRATIPRISLGLVSSCIAG